MLIRARIRRPALVALAVVVLLGLGAPATAQRDDDPVRARDAVRAERARAAAELDPLQASDLEIDQAIADLDAWIAVQEAKVADAQQAVETAERALAGFDARVAETEARIAELRADVVDRAVRAYVFPTSDLVGDLLLEADWAEAPRREAFLAQVTGHQRDAIDELQAAEQDAALLRMAAVSAAAEAGETRRIEQERLEELRATRAEKERLRTDLDARIAGLLAEIEALESSEAELERRVREQQAALAARAAAPATTAGSQPGSSPAPTPDAPAPSGSGSSSGSSGSGSSGSASSSPAPAPAPPSAVGSTSSAGLQWPVSGPVTSEYGQRWGRLHAGIDIAPPSGTPIYAAAAGTVVLAGWNGGYGNTVVIDHGGGLTTLYAHQSRMAVDVGAGVSQGQLIGYVGSTGNSTGPHLHFEVRMNGTPQNPRGYLP